MTKQKQKQRAEQLGVKIANILSDGEFHPPSKELNTLIEETARLMGYDVCHGTLHFMKLLSERGFLRPRGRKETFALEIIDKDDPFQYQPKYSFINHKYIDYTEEEEEEDHFFLGCDWNSGNVWLRCAVNPMGPCIGCELYKPRKQKKPLYRLTAVKKTGSTTKGRLSYLCREVILDRVILNKWVHLCVYLAMLIGSLVLQIWVESRK